jgi:hypothetical protein
MLEELGVKEESIFSDDFTSQMNQQRVSDGMDEL